MKNSKTRRFTFLQEIFPFCQCHLLRLTEIFCQVLCPKSEKNDTHVFFFGYNLGTSRVNVWMVTLRLVYCPVFTDQFWNCKCTQEIHLRSLGQTSSSCHLPHELLFETLFLNITTMPEAVYVPPNLPLFSLLRKC